ncbi:hypothetical protein DPMN_140985 [Dreissena polymorpha]|uniref:Uncharacterized protein n=1 Tax=Dreissena polymorpha TaxID=45954 RepID=A0A9D4GCI9_DREPO|nr:hypothetical protein DPMN_140985 [Dreissena polymorpha]
MCSLIPGSTQQKGGLLLLWRWCGCCLRRVSTNGTQNSLLSDTSAMYFVHHSTTVVDNIPVACHFTMSADICCILPRTLILVVTQTASKLFRIFPEMSRW